MTQPTCVQNLTTVGSTVPEIMVDVQQNLNGSCDLIMPLSGMICHLCASTFYCQTIKPNL